MSMNNHDRAAQPSNPLGDSDGSVDDVFAATQRRMSQRRSAPKTGPAPAEAIGALTGSSNPVNKYLANRNARPVTMRRYEDKLRRAAELLVEAGFVEGAGIRCTREFPWHRVSVADADALSQLLTRKYSSAKSRENVLGVVRSVLRQCARAELLDRRTCDELLDALPVRGGETNVAGRELSDNELLALLGAVMANPNQVLATRDAAILYVFMSTGCRVSELVDFDLRDYRSEDRSLLVRVTKSNRPVRVWLADEAAERLEHWLAIRGANSGPLFLSWYGERLTTSGVGFVLRSAKRSAGLSKRTTSHDFRRTFITRMLRAGVDPFTVRRLVNHKNVATTMVYDRRTEEEDRQAVERLKMPDPRTTLAPNGHAPNEEESP